MSDLLTWWVLYGALGGLRRMSMEGSKVPHGDVWRALWSLHAMLGSPCIGELPL